ncbi:MAG: protein translocase subunit SecD [Methylococcales bacterium]
MQNRFPFWKNFLILFVFLIGLIYALPNIFGEDPSVQISPLRGASLDESTQTRIDTLLEKEGVASIGSELNESQLLVRFNDTNAQLKAADLLRSDLGSNYTVALNLAPATPGWLRAINGKPMYLGLDLRGGVHFLLKVDMEAAVAQAEERYTNDIRTTLRKEKVRYLAVSRKNHVIEVEFKDAQIREEAETVLNREVRDLVFKDGKDGLHLTGSLPESQVLEIRKLALAQNITTLRNRVNELGVAEPVIQQNGQDRIVVQLPGVQDTALAKEILGATATLEFRLVDIDHDVQDAVKRGHAPVGSRLYFERDGQPVLLRRGIIVTGDQIVRAKSGLDQHGSASVDIALDGAGAKKMMDTTKKNVGKPMAVVFIENKTTTSLVNGKKVRKKEKIEEVINVATIRGVFSSQFQITGLDSTKEAYNLALLLRAGALAAPIDIVEERTVGPSLGKENIKQGFYSVMIGLALVVLFMAFYYKVFGIIADVALIMNLVLIVAFLSMLQATLTLPGIAGIVLTVGMAVDANVLIFERIREELRNGNSPQTSIYVGYEKAFSTIFDANITTLIAAIVLFYFGTGPIKGFAVTLSIGILTSMFTAILGTRMLVNKIYGDKRLEKVVI